MKSLAHNINNLSTVCKFIDTMNSALLYVDTYKFGQYTCKFDKIITTHSPIYLTIFCKVSFLYKFYQLFSQFCQLFCHYAQ